MTFYSLRMCRNITTLRGLEPEATDEEIESAARQYVRKVSGVGATSKHTEEAFEKAVRIIGEVTTELLVICLHGLNHRRRCLHCDDPAVPRVQRKRVIELYAAIATGILRFMWGISTGIVRLNVLCRCTFVRPL